MKERRDIENEETVEYTINRGLDDVRAWGLRVAANLGRGPE
jgi:hypothetical protein